MRGYKSILCSKCGSLKLGAITCETCGPKYRGRTPALDSTKTILAERKAKRRQERLAYMRRYNTDFGKRSKKQRQIYFRLLQVTLGKLLHTVEQDSTGECILYADRLDEFQVAVREATRLLYESLKHFPMPNHFEEDYKQAMEFLKISAYMAP